MKAFFERGNFIAVKDEVTYEITKKDIAHGNIPKDISGVYLKNGPNNIYES